MALILKQEANANVTVPPAGSGAVFLNASDQISIKDNGGNVATVPTFSASGNQSVFFNDSGILGQSNSFIWNDTTKLLTVSNVTVTGTLSAPGFSSSSISNGNSNVSIATSGGNVTTSVNGNANIIVVTGTGANVNGYLTVTGNVAGGNLNTSGKVVASTLESNVTTGTAPFTVASTTKVVNLNADLLDGYSTATANTADTVAVRDSSGNLSAVYFIGNGSQLTGIDATSIQNGNSNVKVSANGNVTISVAGNANIVTVTGTGANVDGYLTATGNITAANANLGNIATANYITGTLTTAAQPNITSVGTLSSLSATGNLSGNNLSTTNKVTAGNGLQVTTGSLSILSGNLDVTGNVNVTGNLNYSNVTDLVVGDPLIYIGANNTGDTYDLGIVASYNNGTYYHTGIARNAATDYWTFFDGVVAEPTTVIDWANATYPTVKLGNLIATGTANITGNANVGNIGATGGVFTTVAGSLTTAAQPNVTSIGSLTGLTVSNASGVVDFTTTANVTLGAVANLRITGGSANQYLQTNGSGTLTWANVSSGGLTITNDTSTDATYYPTFTTSTSGSISAANVSSTKLYFNPSTGALASIDYSTLSDINFKDNVTPIVNGMMIVANIEPVSFTWIDTGKKAFGVIAQEIEKILPDIVTTSPEGKKTVSYDQIIPFLVSAIQDLHKQIQELKNRN